MKTKLPDNPRILITRTDRIGDLVISTTVFQILRKRFPGAHLAVCVFREHRELVQGNPFLDEVLLYEKAGHEKGLWGQFCFAQEIRKKKFDAVIHLHATNRMHLMGWLAGIPVRVGYDRRAPWALTEIHPYDKSEGKKHESEYLSYLCSEVSPQPQKLVRSENVNLPFVPVSAGMRISIGNLLQHYKIFADESFAVIHPSASDVTKMWPAEKFSQLIFALGSAQPHGSNIAGSSGGFRWIAVGGKEASAQAQKIRELSGVSLIDLCGKLSLGMLAALFEKAQIVISNDSGPAHIAAAVGTPTVSIFGRWQPGLNAERWRPLGEKVAIVTPHIENIHAAQRKFTYIEEIKVADVLKAAESILPGVRA